MLKIILFNILIVLVVLLGQILGTLAGVFCDLLWLFFFLVSKLATSFRNDFLGFIFRLEPRVPYKMFDPWEWFLSFFPEDDEEE